MLRGYAVTEPYAAIAEMRHRVANDLALLVGVLDQQRRGRGLLTADEALDDAIGAILGLALYYRRLYELDEGVEFVSLPEHLDAIARGLREAYLDRLGIALDCRCDAVFAPPPAARDIGLIVVELVANAAKHAFPDDRGRIAVTLDDADAALICEVRDDGRGLDQTTLGRSASGLSACARMAAGLGGRLDLGRCAKTGGAAFALIIPRNGSAPAEVRAGE
jgi:two-component sensor histidine kinase